MDMVFSDVSDLRLSVFLFFFAGGVSPSVSDLATGGTLRVLLAWVLGGITVTPLGF